MNSFVACKMLCKMGWFLFYVKIQTLLFSFDKFAHSRIFCAFSYLTKWWLTIFCESFWAKEVKSRNANLKMDLIDLWINKKNIHYWCKHRTQSQDRLIKISRIKANDFYDSAFSLLLLFTVQLSIRSLNSVYLRLPWARTCANAYTFACKFHCRGILLQT